MLEGGVQTRGRTPLLASGYCQRGNGIDNGERG
jgi:hypothetical protein